MQAAPRVEVRRSDTRPVTAAAGRSTRHSFAFGEHYDPRNTSFGPLLAHNDETVRPGAGYPAHTHRDVEIVTWVVAGRLTHTDPRGRTTALPAGHAQVLSAGTGYQHAETVDPDGTTTRFVQAWLTPVSSGGRPARQSAAAGPPTWGWTPLASGLRDALLPLRAAATLWLGRLPGDADGADDAGDVDGPALPEASRHHVFVVSGRVALADRALEAGDAARLTRYAGAPVAAVGAPAAELLVWALPPGAAGCRRGPPGGPPMSPRVDGGRYPQAD